MKLTPADTLVDFTKHGGLLRKWFDDKIAELKMIYRASEHQFTHKSFEHHCAEKGPTLSVFQAENGSVFGGFTAVNWTRKPSKLGDWTIDS